MSNAYDAGASGGGMPDWLARLGAPFRAAYGNIYNYVNPPPPPLDSLTARPAPTTIMDPSIQARIAAMRPPAYANYPQSAGGYAPKPPMPTAWPDSSTPTGMPAPPPVKPVGAAAKPAPLARQPAAAPQAPWITSDFDRQNLPAGNGPLGRNAQTKQGMLDLSKLFNRTG